MYSVKIWTILILLEIAHDGTGCLVNNAKGLLYRAFGSSDSSGSLRNYITGPSVFLKSLSF